MSDQPILRVTTRDLELGDENVKELTPGRFLVVSAEPLYVAHQVIHRNGTIVVTLKRREQAGGVERA